MPYDKKPFRSFFKEDKPPKKTGQQKWNEMKKRSLQKQIKKHIMTAEADKAFYLKVWNERDHKCEECFCTLNAGKPDGDKYVDNIRFFSHHIAPKSKFKQFRHTALNIALLCRSCHAKAESAVSLPKMRVYDHFQEIKKHLLGE